MTSIEQSCDQLVCRCRSARIHGRSASGSPSTARRAGGAARRRVELVELALRRRRSSGARRPRAPRAPRARGSSASSARRATAAAASSGCSSTPGGVGDRRAGRRRLEPQARRALRAPGRRSQPRSGAGARLAARGASRTRHAVAQRARHVRPPDQRLRPQQDDLPARQLAQRAQHCAGERRARPAATRATISGASPPGRKQLACRRPRRRARSRPGSARAAAAATSLGRDEQRVDAREQALALRLARRVREPLGGEERRDARASARRAARGTTGSAGRARTRARRRSGPRASASVRLSRTPTGTPMLLAARDRHGRAERDHVRVGAALQRAPAGRSSRARFDGASTVTWCPSSRSSAAIPATCSLTSCGCDQRTA